MFDLAEVQDNLAKDRPSFWHYLDIPWSPSSTYPLKAFVNDGGGQYGAWSEEYGAVRDKLGGKVKNPKNQQKNLALHTQGQIPLPVQRAAEKKAVKESGTVLAVAYSGPVFKTEKDMDAWIAGDLEVKIGGKPLKVPENSKGYFAQTADGWKVPEETEPPPEWWASDEEFQWLCGNEVFCSQVAIIRSRLDDESGQQQDDEVAEKNFESGPTTRARKGGSTKPTKAISKT